MELCSCYRYHDGDVPLVLGFADTFIPWVTALCHRWRTVPSLRIKHLVYLMGPLETTLDE